MKTKADYLAKKFKRFPSWQHRIRGNVSRIIIGDVSVKWGRTYANFLQEQADAINEALGQPEHVARREERGRERTRLYHAVHQLVRANPEISAYKIAQLTGASDMTVWRYLKHIRERFSIKEPVTIETGVDLANVPDAASRRLRLA